MAPTSAMASLTSARRNWVAVGGGGEGGVVFEGAFLRAGRAWGRITTHVELGRLAAGRQALAQARYRAAHHEEGDKARGDGKRAHAEVKHAHRVGGPRDGGVRLCGAVNDGGNVGDEHGGAGKSVPTNGALGQRAVSSKISGAGARVGQPRRKGARNQRANRTHVQKEDGPAEQHAEEARTEAGAHGCWGVKRRCARLLDGNAHAITLRCTRGFLEFHHGPLEVCGDAHSSL